MAYKNAGPGTEIIKHFFCDKKAAVFGYEVMPKQVAIRGSCVTNTVSKHIITDVIGRQLTQLCYSWKIKRWRRKKIYKKVNGFFN